MVNPNIVLLSQRAAGYQSYSSDLQKKKKQCVVFKQVKNFIDTPVRNITEGEFKVVLINCGANVF